MFDLQIGLLTFRPIQELDVLTTESVSRSAHEHSIAKDVFVTQIDASFADTASFCEKYEIDLNISTNCLVVEAKRGDDIWYCACLVLASDMADVNGVIRKALGARKTSFAPKEIALELTKMEYGGITPIGLPKDWVVYIDESVADCEMVVIGSGVRGSKIAVKPSAFLELPNTQVLNIKKVAL